MDISRLFYKIADDLKKYPKAWFYGVVGGRNTGKTYNALDYFLTLGETIVFCKRNNIDIDTICAGNQLGNKAAEYDIDLSPYKPINRDKGTHIKAFKIKDGLGAFYNVNDEGSAYGSPVAYLVSLFAVSKIKGFDLSESTAIIFDEFIPQPWDRIQKKEGEQLLDLYMTVNRDRKMRGKPELKIICLANAVNIYNPTLEILELTDIMTELVITKQDIYYSEERGIMLRKLETPEELMEQEQDTGIYKATKDTAWGKMAFQNEFAYNDFTAVKRVALKNYRPVCAVKHKLKTWYIYVNEAGCFYMCGSKGKTDQEFDLNIETQAKLFYYEYGIDLMNAAIEDRMKFEKYTMYDLIMNYKKRFTI